MMKTVQLDEDTHIKLLALQLKLSAKEGKLISKANILKELIEGGVMLT